MNKHIIFIVKGYLMFLKVIYVYYIYLIILINIELYETDTLTTSHYFDKLP
jgi:hypothetical protein